MTILHQWYYLILKVLLWLRFHIFITQQILEKTQFIFFNLTIVPKIYEAFTMLNYKMLLEIGKHWIHFEDR